MDGSEYPDGTQIEYKKVETDDYTTIDETITCTDGTEVVVHILKEMEITTTEQTTTFPVTGNLNDPKTETVKEEKGVKPGKGNVEDRTTTTEYGDGKKITETYLTEGLTQKIATSKETINPDGSSEKETFSTENVDDDTNTKSPYAISKSYLKKDANGNITQDVVTDIGSQDPEGKLATKETKTTTNYSSGVKTGSIVEIMQNTEGNDALFTKETKDASGKTTLIEKEYLFYETSNYDYHHGVNNDENRMPSSSVKVILKDDGTSKQAKITTNETFPNDTYNHKVFVTTRLEDITQIKFENDKITILTEGGHVEPTEDPNNPGNWTYPIVGGTEVNDEYIIDENLTLSFDSKF